MLEFRPAHVPSFRKKLGAELLRRSDRDQECPADALGGLRILITDACSEVGRATAARLASHGARLVLVAPQRDQLVSACAQLTDAGGQARWHRCDLSALGDVDQLVRWTLAEFETVDVLINNAGRPLRRPLAQSLDRFRDYQRMMAANYFGPLRLTLGLLPAMLHSGSGQVINVGPWSRETGAAPHFASYAAAQAAWTTFGRSADAELSAHGIQVHAVQYPAVGAVGPGTLFGHEYALDPTGAALSVETAIRAHPGRIEPRLARTLRGLAGVAPRSTHRLLQVLGI
ncbi:SDR family NAD(P)-dependent oxidoreductase [Nocardia sp. NPDC048505]|uniref:SDR family NAD(P)-dependent oxidoreductase n=1 Tax=Nocardia sp. NPDC048505 TaxID=3155756 RepID=UPI0033F2E88C